MAGHATQRPFVGLRDAVRLRNVSTVMPDERRTRRRRQRRRASDHEVRRTERCACWPIRISPAFSPSRSTTSASSVEPTTTCRCSGRTGWRRPIAVVRSARSRRRSCRRAPRPGADREGAPLAAQLGLHAIEQLRRRCHEQRRGVGPGVPGLVQQIRSQHRIGSAVGDDEALGRLAGHRRVTPTVISPTCARWSAGLPGPTTLRTRRGTSPCRSPGPRWPGRVRLEDVVQAELGAHGEHDRRSRRHPAGGTTTAIWSTPASTAGVPSCTMTDG